VDVEIVEHEDDLLGVRVVDIDQIPDDVGSVDHGPPFGHLHMPPSGQWLIPQEEVGGAVPLVLIVLAAGISR
jgi:hypothetical protein